MSLESERDFYNNLPEYVRFVNSELGLGLLKHVTDAVQPELDRVYNELDNIHYFHNPDFCPKEWLPWLGQWVGLGAVGGHYLGIGINPDWPEWKQRRLIKEAFLYWRIKGTVPGIRKAIDLWLWQESNNSKLVITFPFSRTPTCNPSNWWSYLTPYGDQIVRTFGERKSFGDSTFPSSTYEAPLSLKLERPSYSYWDYRVPWGETFLVQENSSPSTQITNWHTHLGPNRPWVYFEHLSEDEWNEVFPDILRLNPEIFFAHDSPSVMGWLEPNTKPPIITVSDIQLAQISKTTLSLDVDGWHYYEPYWLHVKTATTKTLSTSTSVEYAATAGVEWTDAYNPYNNLPAAIPYGSKSGSRIEIVETTISVPGVGCTPGVETKLQIGNQLTTESGLPHVTDLILQEVPAHTIQTRPREVKEGIYPGFLYGMSWFSTAPKSISIPSIAYESREVSFSEKFAISTNFKINLTGYAISPTPLPVVTLSLPQLPEPIQIKIDLSAIPRLSSINFPWRLPSHQIVDYSAPVPSVVRESRGYYCPAVELPPLTTTTPQGLKLDVPHSPIAQWYVPYPHGYSYYKDYPGTPDRVEETPVFEEYWVCNIPKLWTTLTLTKYEKVTTYTEPNPLSWDLRFPQLADIAKADNFSCLLETTEKILVTKPKTFFWQQKDGSRSVYFNPDLTVSLYVEFVFKIGSVDLKAKGRSLLFKDKVIDYWRFEKLLNFPAEGVYGFQLSMPLEFKRVSDRARVIGDLLGVHPNASKNTGMRSL